MGADFASYQPIYTGKVGTIERDGLIASVPLLGADADLEEDLLRDTYAGTGGAEGPETLKGNFKPWASGVCLNVEPKWIDPANLIWQYHNGPCGGALKVYDRANDLGAKAGTYTTYLDLKNATLAPGTWADCPTLGMFRFASAPSGPVTVDIDGAKDGSTTLSTVGAIVKHMLKLAGIESGKIDSTFDAFTQEWSLYTKSQATFGDVCRKAMDDAGGYLFADASGVWRAGHHYGSKTPTTLSSPNNGSGGPLVISAKQLGVTEPVHKVKIGCDRNWRVLGDSEFMEINLQAGVVAMLTKPIFSIAADASGTITGSFGDAGGTFRVTDGLDDVTTGHGIAYSVVSEVGVDVSINATTGVYTVASMSADTGIAIFRATYAGKDFDAAYTIVKQKQGLPGVDGPAGADGPAGEAPALAPQPSITNTAVVLQALPDGTVIYGDAAGSWKIYQTNGDGSISDVTNSFSYAVIGNPDGLTGPFAGVGDATLMDNEFYAISGGLAPGVTSASLTMQASGTGIYAGITFEMVFNATVVAAPAIDEVAPATPTGLDVTSTVGVEPDGSNYITLVATWIAPTTDANGDPLTDLSHYEFAYTLAADTTFADANVVISGGNRFEAISRANTVMRARVRAVDVTGNRSAWSADDTFTTASDTNAPAAPTGVSVTAVPGGSFFLNWTNPSDSDLAAVVLYENSTNSSGTATAAATISVAPGSKGWTSRSATTGTVRYFWLKAQDSSGNLSAFSSGVNATIPLITGPDLAANSITTNHMSAGSINGDRIQANTLSAAAILAGSVLAASVVVGSGGPTIGALSDPAGLINSGSTMIAPGKIQISGSTALSSLLHASNQTLIDGGKIFTNSITTNAIAAGAITSTELGTSAVTDGKIASTTITGGKLVTGTITATQLSTDSVTAIKIAANAVTTDKINANAVTAAKISVSSLDAVSATVGLLRTATSGARVEIASNQFRVYDSSNVLRVRIGVW